MRSQGLVGTSPSGGHSSWRVGVAAARSDIDGAIATGVSCADRSADCLSRAREIDSAPRL